MPHFDSLVHATRDGRWLGGTRYDASLSRLLREMDAAEVDRACLVGIADYAETEDVAAFAQDHADRLVPIAGLNPVKLGKPAGIRSELDRIAGAGFRGIKLHPRLNGYDPLDPLCVAAIQLAGEARLTVFLDTLFRQPQTAVRHPVDVVDLIVKQCLSTRLILLHSCGPHMLGLFDLGRMHENIVLDLSFSLLRYAGSSLDLDMTFLFHQLDQRVILGSDFPEYTPTQSLRRFAELTPELPAIKRDAILWGNLASIFP